MIDTVKGHFGQKTCITFMITFFAPYLITLVNLCIEWTGRSELLTGCVRLF